MYGDYHKFLAYLNQTTMKPAAMVKEMINPAVIPIHILLARAFRTKLLSLKKTWVKDRRTEHTIAASVASVKLG